MIMPTVSDVSRFLGDFAPLTLAESWDNVGLLLGDYQRPADRILTCLTITPDVVTEAVSLRINLIVSHHPLMFKPVQRLVSSDVQGAMLLKLISAGIAVYSPHTAFDSALAGINQQLAEAFGLQQIQPFRLKITSIPDTSTDNPVVGAGRYGTLPVPVSLDQLCQQTKNVLKIQSLQRVGAGNFAVQRVGIACGAAAEFIPDAIKAGCEVLLTGEARFHDCLRARDSGLALILPGHYATERPAVEALAGLLQRQFPDSMVAASQQEHDPVHFA